MRRILVRLGAGAVAVWRRRVTRWLTIPAVAATAAAGFMLAGSSPALAQGLGVTPVLNCVEVDGQTITAVWGYENTSGSTQILPVGGENWFPPGPSGGFDHGQPITFLPGDIGAVFDTPFPSGTTLTWNLGDGSVTASATSPQCGIPGPAGPTGPAGPPGPAGSSRVVGSPVTITGPGLGLIGTATAACPSGTVLLGGGAQVDHSGVVVTALESSYPSSTTVWTATAAALLMGRRDTMTVTAYALCSLPSS